MIHEMTIADFYEVSKRLTEVNTIEQLQTTCSQYAEDTKLPILEAGAIIFTAYTLLVHIKGAELLTMETKDKYINDLNKIELIKLGIKLWG
jgi:hypothetical protein